MATTWAPVHKATQFMPLFTSSEEKWLSCMQSWNWEGSLRCIGHMKPTYTPS